MTENCTHSVCIYQCVWLKALDKSFKILNCYNPDLCFQHTHFLDKASTWPHFSKWTGYLLGRRLGSTMAEPIQPTLNKSVSVFSATGCMQKPRHTDVTSPHHCCPRLTLTTPNRQTDRFSMCGVFAVMEQTDRWIAYPLSARQPVAIKSTETIPQVSWVQHQALAVPADQSSASSVQPLYWLVLTPDLVAVCHHTNQQANIICMSITDKMYNTKIINQKIRSNLENCIGIWGSAKSKGWFWQRCK